MGAYKSAAGDGGLQFGAENTGSGLSADEKAYYRCAIPADGGVAAALTAASNPMLHAPGALTAWANRNYGAGSPAAASPAELMKAKLAAAALASFRWTPSGQAERDGDVSGKYDAWRVASDKTVLAFKAMLTKGMQNANDYVFYNSDNATNTPINGFTDKSTGANANKRCHLEDQSYTAPVALGGGTSTVANVATALDANSVLANAVFDGVLDVTGAQLTVVDTTTVKSIADGPSQDAS